MILVVKFRAPCRFKFTWWNHILLSQYDWKLAYKDSFWSDSRLLCHLQEIFLYLAPKIPELVPLGYFLIFCLDTHTLRPDMFHGLSTFPPPVRRSMTQRHQRDGDPAKKNCTLLTRSDLCSVSLLSFKSAKYLRPSVLKKSCHCLRRDGDVSCFKYASSLINVQLHAVRKQKSPVSS